MARPKKLDKDKKKQSNVIRSTSNEMNNWLKAANKEGAVFSAWARGCLNWFSDEVNIKWLKDNIK